MAIVDPSNGPGSYSERRPSYPRAADQPGRSAEGGRRRLSRYALLVFGVAAVVVAVDIASKATVVATIPEGENVRILGGLVYLTQLRNPGMAFTLATGMTWLLAIFALAVVVVLIRIAPRLRSRPWAICFGLILGGALGNLVDRVFRAPGFLQGHVVDFVSVFGPNAEYFPAFNAADSAITVGAVLLVSMAVFGYDINGQRRGRKRGG